MTEQRGAFSVFVDPGDRDTGSVVPARPTSILCHLLRAGMQPLGTLEEAELAAKDQLLPAS
jgi:hypothetical protein